MNQDGGARATGTLYGVGLGPGDPELMTLKAHRLISSARVVAYPAPDTGESFARSIAADAIRADALAGKRRTAPLRRGGGRARRLPERLTKHTRRGLRWRLLLQASIPGTTHSERPKAARGWTDAESRLHGRRWLTSRL